MTYPSFTIPMDIVLGVDENELVTHDEGDYAPQSLLKELLN